MVFSGDDFAVRTVGYKYDYSAKVFYRALVPDSWEVSIDAFTISLEGDYLELENGVFSATNSVPTNVEYFDVIMNVSVADSLGSAKPIKYRLRYHYSVGELVSVSYTHKEGIRKEAATTSFGSASSPRRNSRASPTCNSLEKAFGSGLAPLFFFRLRALHVSMQRRMRMPARN